MRILPPTNATLENPENFKGMKVGEATNQAVVSVRGNYPWTRQALEVTRFAPKDQTNLKIIRFCNFSEYPTRPFEMARSSVLSQYLNADVITVGFPGASTNLELEDTELTRQQRVDLSVPLPYCDTEPRRTSFQSTARACVQALHDALTVFGLDRNHFDSGKTVFDLCSMGCNTGIAALAYMRPDVVLMREVPGRANPQSLGRTMATWGAYAWRGDKLTYKPDNKLLDGVPSDAEFLRFISRYSQLEITARGIAGSSIPRDIVKASDRLDFRSGSTRFVLMPGTLSRVSDKATNVFLAERIAQVTGQEVGISQVNLGRHALINSLPLNAEMTQRGIRMADDYLG